MLVSGHSELLRTHVIWFMIRTNAYSSLGLLFFKKEKKGARIRRTQNASNCTCQCHERNSYCYHRSLTSGSHLLLALPNNNGYFPSMLYRFPFGNSWSLYISCCQSVTDLLKLPVPHYVWLTEKTKSVNRSR